MGLLSFLGLGGDETTQNTTNQDNRTANDASRGGIIGQGNTVSVSIQDGTQGAVPLLQTALRDGANLSASAQREALKLAEVVVKSADGQRVAMSGLVVAGLVVGVFAFAALERRR